MYRVSWKDYDSGQIIDLDIETNNQADALKYAFTTLDDEYKQGITHLNELQQIQRMKSEGLISAFPLNEYGMVIVTG